MENRRSSRHQSSGRNAGGADKRSGGTGEGRKYGGPKRAYDRSGPRAGGDSSGKKPFWKRTGESARSDGRSGGYGQRSGPRQSMPSRGQKGPSRPGARKNSIPELKITSDLQLTDGRYRAKLLSNSLRPAASPTPRKLREVMFKVVSRRVKAHRFLDLGCGCGTVGFEAISRGAMLSTFVDRSARMRSFLEKNVKELGLKTGHSELRESEILSFLKNAEKRRRRWDLVFLGTRDNDTATDTFAALARGTSLVPGGLLLVEHGADLEFPETIGRLRRWRVIKTDDSCVTIFERP